MKFKVFADYKTLCAAVADEVVQQLHAKPGSVLVFPTGNTPLGLFSELVARETAGEVEFRRAHFVILDEYADLAPGDRRSLTDWLDREFLSRIGMSRSQVYDFEHSADHLERKIVSLGGLDLVILGLGPNGHLGFNEPGSPFGSRARSVSLAPATIASNAAYWGSEEQVPRVGHTLGLGTLCEARRLILMVSGQSKRNILNQVRTGEIAPDLPATVLRTISQAEIFADEQAAGRQISGTAN